MKEMRLLAALAVCGALAFGVSACSNSSGNSAASLVGLSGGGTQDPVFTPVYETFGSWPQTVMAAGVTVNESETEIHGALTYCKGSDGAWYVKRFENSSDGICKYSDGTTVKESSANSYKWFKVEPIKWRVLTANYNGTGKKLLLAEKILANCKYYDYKDVNRSVSAATVYPNNYEHSKVRAFLNGLSYKQKQASDGAQNECDDFLNKGFLQSAFTPAELAKIADTSVDNSADGTADSGNNLPKSTDYACGNTNDKVFLLSEREATNSEYGFPAYKRGGTGNARIRKATDYAMASGAYQSAYAGNGGQWWIRSPNAASASTVRHIGGGGHADLNTIVNDESTGLVPALCVSD